MDMQEWADTHQDFEKDWWGSCVNTFAEELKQVAYARVMGLDPGPWERGFAWPVYELGDRAILDVGGGPVSMLLKSHTTNLKVVVDPCEYPLWVRERYNEHGVNVVRVPAEEFTMDLHFDEAWIYNVLQHTYDPEKIAHTMCQVADVVRVFEWVETPSYLGHPQSLTVPDLSHWFGGDGRVVRLDAEYREVPLSDPPAPGREEQLGWGGVFHQ